MPNSSTAIAGVSERAYRGSMRSALASAVGHKPTFIPPPVIGRFTPQGCHRHLSVEAHDSIAWLAAMVPRRINITQFYGVFAPNGG